MSGRVRTMRERSRESVQGAKKTSPPFHATAMAFLEVQRGRGNKMATLKHYENTIKKLKRFLAWERHEDSFDQMDEDDILEVGGAVHCSIFNDKNIESHLRRFLLDVEEVSEVTVSTYFRDYRAIAYWMMDEKILISRVISFKSVEGDIKDCYTEKEISRLLKKPHDTCTFAEYRSWVLVHWLLATGNRISTVCNVRIDDVDFEDNMININVQKSGRKHRIPLSPKLKAVLQEYIAEWLDYGDGHYASPYLFPGSYTQSSNHPVSRGTLSQALADYNTSRGVKKTSCHLFRHTFTKNWILNNGDLHSLQKILGHSTLDMVTKYANLWGEDLKPKVEKFALLETHQLKNSGRMIQRKKLQVN